MPTNRHLLSSNHTKETQIINENGDELVEIDDGRPKDFVLLADMSQRNTIAIPQPKPNVT